MFSLDVLSDYTFLSRHYCGLIQWAGLNRIKAVIPGLHNIAACVSFEERVRAVHLQGIIAGITGSNSDISHNFPCA